MEQDYESIFPQRRITYASFWSRLLAVFLDGLILSIPNKLITFVCDGLIGGFAGNMCDFIIGTIFMWLYFALQNSSYHQGTLGKRACSIRVTTFNGDTLTFEQATKRHFAAYLSAIILFIGYLMMPWDKNCQTLHDKIAGSIVITDK